MIIPVVNPQQAGLVAASADMNAYSNAASFLCNPPMVQALAKPSAQAITGSVITAITWAAPARDNDSTFNGTTGFVLATTGYYQVAAHVSLANTVADAETFIRLTTGASNPAGAGNVTDWWHGNGTISGSVNITVGSAGLIPVLIYATDTLQFMVQVQATGATAASNGWWGDWFHQMVST